jgi:two-component system sensor histidine kinase YesM
MGRIIGIDLGTKVTIRLPYQQKGDSHAADITGG